MQRINLQQVPLACVRFWAWPDQVLITPLILAITLMLKRALLELAQDNKRFGHPRLFTLLKRDKNIHVNHKRSEIDFVFDYIESGRRLKVLTMVDEKTKVSPALMVAHSIRGFDLGPFIELACEKIASSNSRRSGNRVYFEGIFRLGIQK